MKPLDYKEIDGGLPFYLLVGAIGVFVLAGLGAAFYMEHNGHWVTGMSNQIRHTEKSYPFVQRRNPTILRR